jgi:hypothetical protein
MPWWIWLVAAYFGLAVFRGLQARTPPRGDDRAAATCWDILFFPAYACLLLVAGLLATVGYWLYPERHLTVIDLEGTCEERRQLTDYRRALARKPFLRRVGEKLGGVQANDPPFRLSNPD